MDPKKNVAIQDQIKSIASNLGVDEEKASAIAQKCYEDIVFRPYGGATSFAEINQLEATRQYTYKIDDATYKLRGIIENISYEDDMETADKVSAIKTAADEYGNIINSMDVMLSDTGEIEGGEKGLIERIKEALGSKRKYNAQQRRDMAKKGWARPDGSYPIADVADLKNAIRTFGLGGSNPADKAHIKKRARALGATDQLPDGWKSLEGTGFKILEDENGKYRWLAFSSNAFEDQEKELFSTKALEEAVEYAEKENERGPLMVFHIPGTEIGQCDFQAVQGRFLIESGTFDDTPMGQKALEYFLSSEDDHQVSIGYKYVEGDEQDGTYDWLRFRERSVCPMGTAANPWTDFQIFGGKEMDEKHKSTLVSIFGEEMANDVISKADEKTKELQDQGVRHKATADETQKQSDGEVFVRQLAKSLGIDEEKAVEEARKLATTSETKEETKEEVKAEEVSQAPAFDNEKLGQMAQLIADMAEQVDSLTHSVKELKESDDSKIANAVAPRAAITNMFSAENTSVISEEAAKEITKENNVENENPALAYVRDLMPEFASTN